ncbi:zinc-binding alcohol dehydrogenase family protein [Streptomyces sp. NPDC059070]|uniref:quinone oxidoreductase family protein n=1 Tax=Streptomyces sp. NPDC059070 TaxID=3346713 RepID=UPI00368F7580
MRAIMMREAGGPDVLLMEEVADPQPRGGHHLIAVSRAGVNYADVHLRENSYLAPIEYPIIPGNEVVGTLPDGRRVVALSRGGGYAETALTHRRVTWEVPDGVSDDQALALTLQGNSAWHLLHSVLGVRAGESVLIPAAAGGVGSLAVQLAKRLGAKVIAMAGADKHGLVRDLGADVVLDSSNVEGLAERVVEANGGPVQAALEMTGGDVFDATLDALSVRGRMAVYGCVSGDQRSASVTALTQGSKTVSGFWLPNLYGDRTALKDSMADLFAATAAGELRPVVGPCYPLADARRAHLDLVGRATIGKVSLDTTR